MIVEMIALALLLGSATGLVTTFVVWNRAGLRRLRRFMAQLVEGSSFRMDALTIEDTTTPACAQLSDGMHTVELSVTQQALHELWRVRIPLVHQDGRVAWDLVETHYASQRVEWARREGTDFVDVRSHLWRLHAREADAARAFLDEPRVRTAITALLHQDVLMRRCSLHDDELEVEFDRIALSRDEALGVLNAVAQLADAVEGRVPTRRMLPASDDTNRVVHHSLNGAPLGVPLGRGRH